MIEEWKDAINYNGLYQVSNLGRIRNTKEKIIKQYKDHKGYLITQLTNGKTSKTIRVHRLIAMTFIPNIKNKAQVNHINCNKADNRIENLEWVTNNENKIHAKRHGLCKSSIKGEKNKRAKRVNQYNLDGKLVRKWNCMNDIARIAKLITTKFNNDYSIDNKDKEALEHILSDYKRVLKENEELNLKYYMLYTGKIENLKAQEVKIKSQVIPVQKVKDKIEELKKNLYTVEHYETVGAINVLQELLEGREENEC